jgi:hypothetical protein
MPEIEAYADIDPDDFWSACSTREKKDLVDIIIEDSASDKEIRNKLVESLGEHYPDLTGVILDSTQAGYTSFMRDEFISSLAKLGQAYYSLSSEDIEKVKELAKRF